jgi:hypothetical protein
MGVVVVESLYADVNIWIALDVESHETNASPLGIVLLMKLLSAVVILSGLKHLIASSF